MIRKAVAAGVFATLPLVAALPCTAGTVDCRGAVRVGASVNGNSAGAFDVMESYGASYEAPDGQVFFAPFAFLYRTRSSRWFMQDGAAPVVVEIPSGDTAGMRVGYRVLENDETNGRISDGGVVFVTHSAPATIVPCYAQ